MSKYCTCYSAGWNIACAILTHVLTYLLTYHNSSRVRPGSLIKCRVPSTFPVLSRSEQAALHLSLPPPPTAAPLASPPHPCARTHQDRFTGPGLVFACFARGSITYEREIDSEEIKQYRWFMVLETTDHANKYVFARFTTKKQATFTVMSDGGPEAGEASPPTPSTLPSPTTTTHFPLLPSFPTGSLER